MRAGGNWHPLGTSGHQPAMPQRRRAVPDLAYTTGQIRAHFSVGYADTTSLRVSTFFFGERGDGLGHRKGA
jgi:hypothetical protein